MLYIGKKVEMLQFFTPEGKAFGATAIELIPMKVTGNKTLERDGYVAVQFGYGKKRASLINKAITGSVGALGSFEGLKEYRTDQVFEIGNDISLDGLETGSTITVSGISKGKGFQGVVKRHGFEGGRRSHGQKHSEREAGSIGGGGRAGGRVAKGMRMAGRMGADRITVKNLHVLSHETASHVIVVKGAVPGRRGTLLEIMKTQ
jgi:large subunit ribosomal protein L3